MEFPPDKELMHSFLGMVSFLNRYPPRLDELSTSLRQVYRLHGDCKPELEHCQSFNAVKKELSTKIVLPCYDPTSYTTLQGDSSKKGLGDILIQNGTPIYFARRSIFPTESNYQNLEHETLGMIWGIEKFHYFLYANKCTLETDQTPLVSIYWKHLVDVSPRIQRLIVRALPYNFHVVYVPGKLIPMANALSRNLKFTSKDREENQISLPILAVNYITGNYQWHPDKPVMDQIREETSKHATLQLLTKYIRDGYPTDWKKFPKEWHPYWNYWDELSMETRIPLKPYRILIPYSLWMKMLDLIHEGHQGIKKCLLHPENLSSGLEFLMKSIKK